MKYSIFQFVFVFSVENDTVFIKEAHYGCLPSGGAKEVDNYIEEPVLRGQTAILHRLALSNLCLCSYL